MWWKRKAIWSKNKSAKKTLSESNSRTRAQYLSSHRITVHRVCHVSVHRLHQVLVKRDVECQYVELSRVSASSSNFRHNTKRANLMNFYDTNRRKMQIFIRKSVKPTTQNVPPHNPSLSANVDRVALIYRTLAHPLTNIPSYNFLLTIGFTLLFSTGFTSLPDLKDMGEM